MNSIGSGTIFIILSCSYSGLKLITIGWNIFSIYVFIIIQIIIILLMSDSDIAPLVASPLLSLLKTLEELFFSLSIPGTVVLKYNNLKEAAINEVNLHMKLGDRIILPDKVKSGGNTRFYTEQDLETKLELLTGLAKLGVLMMHH